MPGSPRQDSVRPWSWYHRHGLLMVLVSPIVANLIGSLFNVLYNQTQVQPLLSAAQMDRFFDVVWWFNGLVYPVAIACFVVPVWRLRGIHQALLVGDAVEPERLAFARRRVINLPWWFLTVAGIGWLVCIPVFPLAIAAVGEPLSREVIAHLITSFLIASLIAVTQSFFAVELTIQRTLFPVFFQQVSPATIDGTIPLSITHRGILCAFSAVVCPVVSLLLIFLVPDAAHRAPVFAIAVGIVSIAFGFATSLMLGRMMIVPLKQLNRASQMVAAGNLDARVDLKRADEFGGLIDSFNSMVLGLREREKLQATFGRHVGQVAARQILSEGDLGGGRQQSVTVMFVDVRNFTKHSSEHPPEQVVATLNLFFAAAVDRIEASGGMVNKFLGDGLMALFGIGPDADGHADRAVSAAVELQSFVRANQDRFDSLDWPTFAIGVGINSGPAIVGSIGSPQRQEYTAMGDTVNVAARVETLTKVVDRPILITAETRRRLIGRYAVSPVPAQSVKGKGNPVEIFAVEDSSRPLPGEIY